MNSLYLFSLNNISLTILLISFVIMFFLVLLVETPISNWLMCLMWKNLYNFIVTLAKNNLNIKEQIFLPYFFITFSFMAIANLAGMVPYSFTITSHFSITFFLSLSFFIGVNLLGILNHGLEFINLFLPSTSPIIISPLLLLVELMSYLARVFSLSIRLFANMMAGHALMKILVGFSWNFFLLGGAMSGIISVAMLAIILIIIGLELAIALLQAYVYLCLNIIYINDVNSPH